MEPDRDAAESLFQRGVDLHELGRLEEALATYEEAVRLNPSFALLWYNKGNVLHTLGRHIDSLAAYKEAVRLDPKLVPAWNNMGIALGHVVPARFDEALEAFGEAIRRDPNFAAPWHNKGDVLHMLGRRKESFAAHNAAIRLDPKCVPAWTGMGRALNDLGWHEEALVTYQEALCLVPTYAPAWAGMGIALSDLERHKEALAAYDKAIQADCMFALPWANKASIFRHHQEMRGDRTDGDPDRCVRRAVYLAWPVKRLEDMKVLSDSVLALGDAGGAGLLLHRLIARVLPECGLLTVESLLRKAHQETAVARSAFEWLEGESCPLNAQERFRLRGQVLLRFGDPILAKEVLDRLNNSEEGKRDLAGRLYLVLSIREFLEPDDEALDLAFERARKWMAESDFGKPDELTCYFAGHIALAKDDLPMAREAFDRAGLQPHALLMAWHSAWLAGDTIAATDRLDMLLVAEGECLRSGRTGILFPDLPAPFDPESPRGQAELQTTLRRFEVGGALMALLEEVELREHPGYKALAAEFGERTEEFDDIERYENAVLRTWTVEEEVQQQLKRLRQARIRADADKAVEARREDFAFLDVAPPCSLRDAGLVEHLARRLFGTDLARKGNTAMTVILLLLQQERLSAEDATLLTMYANAKAHHNAAAEQQKWVAMKAAEAAVGFLINSCGVSWGASFIGAFGGGKLLEDKVVAGAQAVFDKMNLAVGQPFPTYPEFKEHLHQYWSEWGDPGEMREAFGTEGVDET